ncbi:hypothetical protein P3T23_006001 [Paraburkholderia sp. GAS448]|uniref:hypothetical protein n=1 Tax=Paraburkholderia sp. GAS448 TaxID=3035136 RepID=UPI003D1BEF92
MQQSKSMKGVTSRRAMIAGACALTLVTGAGTLLPAVAQAESDAVKELAAPAPIQLPLKPSAEFAKFPRYTGTLGTRQIVLRLGPKTDDPSGVHGEYQFTDTGQVILVAGDRDGDTLEGEESNDGTHITGNWVGKFAADGTLTGDRTNVDDSDPQPFDLHLLAPGQAAPAVGSASGPGQAATAAAAAAGKPAAAASATPAPTTGGGHPVGGVSNLTTGD